MGLRQRDFCKGLTRGVNTGGGINRLTFGKGTELIIQPCKCFHPGDGDLNADSMGTFPNPADGLWYHCRTSTVLSTQKVLSHVRAGDDSLEVSWVLLWVYLTPRPLLGILGSGRQRIPLRTEAWTYRDRFVSSTFAMKMTFMGVVDMAVWIEVWLFLLFCLHVLFSAWLRDLKLEQLLIIWFSESQSFIKFWQERFINIKPRKGKNKELNSQCLGSWTWQPLSLHQLASTPWSGEVKEGHRRVVSGQSPAALIGVNAAEFRRWEWIPEGFPRLPTHGETLSKGVQGGEQIGTLVAGFCHGVSHSISTGSGRKLIFGTGTRLQVTLGR